MENQKYTMRTLKTKDIFKMSKILKKIDVDFSSIETEGKSAETAGMEMVKVVVENMYQAEDEVNEFLGNLVGLTGEEVSELDLEDGIEIVKQFKNIKGLDFFFKSATKQSKKK